MRSSITLQTLPYLPKQFPEHTYTIDARQNGKQDEQWYAHAVPEGAGQAILKPIKK